MNKILFKLIEGKGKFFLNEDLKNGEIVNPQVLPVSFYHNSVLGLGRLSHNETHEPIDDGQTFDLPDGCGFEEVIGYMDDYSSGKEVCYQMKSIRLIPEKPVQREESQKAMWIDVFKLVDTNHTIEYLSELFTIKRKDS